ncbi:3-hydroxybenzoate 6-hydroxylase-like protein [Limtongia smithiae]|uniref:3-hydroxybenzoate 6-hydroxylase-like protein n=1 Tax=Limtongia smithiae TaxID=1125753 RepID=UPI0034CE392A
MASSSSACSYINADTQTPRRRHTVSGTGMTASSPLKVIVVGAGLGGLACAIAIARKGIHVVLLEQAHILGEVGAGIQIPPNSTSILRNLGLFDKFQDVIVWPQSVFVRRYSDGQVLGTTPLNPYLTQRYGSPYWFIHRADYHRILHDAAVENGVDIHINSRVVSVDETAPSATLATGEVFEADLVITADGIRSRIRDQLFPELNDDVYVASNVSAYRACVSGERMQSDPELRDLLDDPGATSWIGPGRHIMAYPIRDKSIYNLVMLYPGDTAPGIWNSRGDIAEMRAEYKGWDPKLTKVISMIEDCLTWKICYVRELPTWVSASGKVVLLGDAAHATVPFLAQGAAMALEDGVTLAECLDRAHSKADIPKLMHLYEKIRKARCTRVQLGSMQNGDVWHLADGPEQQNRDSLMAAEEAKRVEGAKVERKIPEPSMEIPSYNLKNPLFWSDDEFQPWLFGHDAVKTADLYLTQAGY